MFFLTLSGERREEQGTELHLVDLPMIRRRAQEMMGLSSSSSRENEGREITRGGHHHHNHEIDRRDRDANHIAHQGRHFLCFHQLREVIEAIPVLLYSLSFLLACAGIFILFQAIVVMGEILYSVGAFGISCVTLIWEWLFTVPSSWIGLWNILLILCAGGILMFHNPTHCRCRKFTLFWKTRGKREFIIYSYSLCVLVICGISLVLVGQVIFYGVLALLASLGFSYSCISELFKSSKEVPGPEEGETHITEGETESYVN